METARSFRKDSLDVHIYASRAAMGSAAAHEGAALLRRLLAEQEIVRVIFAAAPSQNEFLNELCLAPDIDWGRVCAFHMDEYVNLNEAAPQGFGNFLREHIFGRLPFGAVNYLNGNAPNTDEECLRYTRLLAQAPIDIVFMGIGENGHIAFNDPPVADFNDPHSVKAVALDDICRNQQVHDGCFVDISQVSTHALTLTVPMLAAAKHHLCIVPAATKAQAVYDTINGTVNTACPASILRTCSNAILFIERESAMLLTEE